MLETPQNQQLGTPQKLVPAESEGVFLPSCSGCLARQISVCPGYGVRERRSSKSSDAAEVRSTTQTFPSRRQILHQREVSDIVPIICSGWAASSISTQNGKRQVVSFLLGGDVASINYLFEPCSGRAIEAVSQVTCRKFGRSEFQAALARHPGFGAIVGKALAAERERGDQLNLDLSRRPADSRIARFILNLSSRLERRGSATKSFDFPIRQQQLADALGLTAVHVCKIMSRFRSAGLIALESRRLTILDRKSLQDLAEQ